MTKKKPSAEVVIDLGDLAPMVKKAAKDSGLDLIEFICDALKSSIRQNREFGHHDFTPHGGKHLFGKHTGYEVTEDGKYYVAPTWQQNFDQLFAERQAIINLANSIVQTAQNRLIEVEKNIKSTKDRLIDDLGLDPAKHWIYYGSEYCIAEEEANDKSEK